MNAGSLRGWFGKLPCAGDFLSQGLPLSMSAALDNWLSNKLHWLNENQADWTTLYFEAPASGFLIEGASANSQGKPCEVVGILMPSVDSVGRLYPFVMLQSFEHLGKPSGQTLHSALTAMWSACSQTLEHNWTPSELLKVLDEEMQTYGLTNSVGSWIEPALLSGPGSWLSLQPEVNQPLAISEISGLRGWPQGASFLQLLRPTRGEA
ncbi:MAG: type VI secretion system-associated protein TagF [Limnobacter sp.]|nr:type VI secretion system-associated protein TagF [Limnobacter sp.]